MWASQAGAWGTEAGNSDPGAARPDSGRLKGTVGRAELAGRLCGAARARLTIGTEPDD